MAIHITVAQDLLQLRGPPPVLGQGKRDIQGCVVSLPQHLHEINHAVPRIIITIIIIRDQGNLLPQIPARPEER